MTSTSPISSGGRLWLIAAAIVLSSTAATEGQQSRSMTRARAAPARQSLNPGQTQIIDKYDNDPAVADTGLTILRVGVVVRDSEFIFEPPDNWEPPITMRRTNLTEQSGRQIWSGRADGTDKDSILVLREKRITGFIHTGNRVFGIRPLGGKLHLVIDWDISTVPGENDPDVFNPATMPTPGAGLFAAPSISFPSVFVAYTEEVLESYLEPEDIEDLVLASLAAANGAFEKSDVHARLVLAGVLGLENYREKNAKPKPGCEDIEEDFTNKLAGIGDLFDLREVFAADVVVTLVDSEPCGGKAIAINADFSEAFCLVNHNLADWYYVLAHEVGHLMGGCHATAANCPYKAGHGFCDAGEFFTIMTRWEECENPTPPPKSWMQRIQRFSNPGKEYPEPPNPNATPTGIDGTSNVVSVFNQNAAGVASFKTPADIAFNSGTLKIDEGDQKVRTIHLTRNGVDVPGAKVLVRSSDESVVTVAPNGIATTGTGGTLDLVITGLSNGKAQITVFGGGKEAEFPVKVSVVGSAGSIFAMILGGLGLAGLLRWRERRQTG